MKINKGFVNLDGCMADDLSVVNAARVSFAQHRDWIDEKDEGLIRFLMKNRHGTPFEHNAMRFHVKCPIFVAREWMRHRIGSFNEWSGRYSKLENEFYVPDHIRTQVGKPGAYTYENISEFQNNLQSAVMRETYSQAWDAYEYLLENKVAKEVARMVLPVGIYTEFYWTVNARSLMNFLSLRNSEHAMLEIREYAQAIETIWQAQMPVTYQAWLDNDRLAP